MILRSGKRNPYRQTSRGRISKLGVVVPVFIFVNPLLLDCDSPPYYYAKRIKVTKVKRKSQRSLESRMGESRTPSC